MALANVNNQKRQVLSGLLAVRPTAAIFYGDVYHATDNGLWYIYTPSGWIVESLPTIITTIAGALPAGTNNIGDVDVVTLPGTVQADIATMKGKIDTIQTDIATIKTTGTPVSAELPVGTKNIGDVDVASLPGTVQTDIATVRADIALIKDQNKTVYLDTYSFPFDADDLTKTEVIIYNGLVKNVHLIVPNFTNPVTVTLTLVDISGRIIWTSAAKAMGTSYNLELDTDWVDQLVDSTLIWTVTLSGVAGGTGGTVILVPRYYGRKSSFPSLGAVTTTPNQTVTIQEWNATVATVIDWGDGQTTNHPALTGTAVSHIYAVTGTYVIRMKVSPLAVTRMDFNGVGLRIYSTNLKQCVNTTYFSCNTGPLGTINSADMVDWRPTSWYCYNLPAGFTGVLNFSDMAAWRPAIWVCYGLPIGFTGVLNSADIVNWRPTHWYCYNLPAGFTGIINSVDMVDWRPVDWICYDLPAGFTGVLNSVDMVDWRPAYWQCFSLPAGLLPLTVAAANFAGWVGCLAFNISGNTLTQVQVDAVLTGLYSAFATRTTTGGTIDVGGNNAAPSGILQAKCPPVTGKEFAYELINDSCGVNPTKKWATVTITA